MSLNIVILESKCKHCYCCLRSCPVKAIRVEDGKASVIKERCITCGNCVKVCPQKARIIKTGYKRVMEFINSNRPTVACLAPSFFVAFHGHDWRKVVGGLRALGFDEVWEVAFGASLLAEETARYLRKTEKTDKIPDGLPNRPLISTACPVVVNLIQKHYPILIKNLLPFASPMQVTGRIIKAIAKGKISTVFIGPCFAKRDEASEDSENSIDLVIDFDELKELFELKNIDLDQCWPADFNNPTPAETIRFSAEGGFAEALDCILGKGSIRSLTVSGTDEVRRLMESLAESSGSLDLSKGVDFIDITFCKGCNRGLALSSQLNPFVRDSIIRNFAKERQKSEEGKVRYGKAAEGSALPPSAYIKERAPNVSIAELVRKEYRDRSSHFPMPSEDEIKAALVRLGKFCIDDELNCGSCGYNSCRDHAIAIWQGIAEVDMCLPNLLNVKNRNLAEVMELNAELDGIIGSICEGICILNSDGEVLRVNDIFRDVFANATPLETGMSIGESGVSELLSAYVLAKTEKRRITLLYHDRKNHRYIITASPIMKDDREIEHMIITLKDINDLNLFDSVSITRNGKGENDRKSRLEGPQIREEGSIVVFSRVMEKVLELAEKVAAVDSTILILGESGVGKEVIARHIHKISGRRDGPFVKINCGAIPENLLESELFGYETGAFTGARPQGKKGLIEMANGGIFFLDEIGELPLHLQVKLLQVIQEHRLVRIGGTKPIDVNIRFIAATNRDLARMVREGAFRQDLYYRLNVVPIVIPSLKERRDDIIPLINHFLQRYKAKYNRNKSLTPRAKEVLVNYDWPGNVRELENLIERLVVTIDSPVIDLEDLPLSLQKSGNGNGLLQVEEIHLENNSLKDTLEKIEKQILESVLQQYENTYKAAEVLGINQSTVVRKMQKFGIKIPQNE